jgi:tRNA wybutosine-synthesizing protein 1
VDVEDVGPRVHRAQGALAAEAAAAASGAPTRDMVTPAQRRALTKEGYKIIGTHSAVKMCRWTKAQLRGRGGCYKHTMYGITSSRCMEATPSLACANKCTFCWRHHKNPVGREWRWKTDAPELIVAEAVAKHVSMIRAFGGAPGVIPERLREAFAVRHCALSLVGEPIMYPRVNELCRLLHARGISTFLVTNAQFPELIAALEPVTQLYVSIDAATRDTLKAIDRPLFADFWERFLGSLDALSRKGQRTVFRMTLVAGQNMAAEHVAPYVELVARGRPDFIEVKGVTFSGKSEGSGGLTMANVPWHAQVRAYCEELAARCGGEYGLACEHAHSCCVLLARKDKFLVDGAWHTHIDFERFQRLVERFYATGEAFRSEDYMLRTPDWALYGAREGGFSPVDTRWYRNGSGPDAAAAAAEAAGAPPPYKPSASGCG